MLQQNSTTTTAPAPTPAVATATTSDIQSLIESAHERARIAARIAQSFESLDEVSFSDLDQIARNCHAAAREIQTVSQLLAESEVSA